MTAEIAPGSTTTGHILVVDDYPLNRLKLARLLEQQGHTVTMAENGQQALALLRTQAFDVILLDIVMPEMDGYQVLAHLQADTGLRDIPVIVISAVDEIDSVVKCIELGALDYLPKPFNPTLLRARLATRAGNSNSDPPPAIALTIPQANAAPATTTRSHDIGDHSRDRRHHR